jgi:hypothetical protein
MNTNISHPNTIHPTVCVYETASAGRNYENASKRNTVRLCHCEGSLEQFSRFHCSGFKSLSRSQSGPCHHPNSRGKRYPKQAAQLVIADCVKTERKQQHRNRRRESAPKRELESINSSPAAIVKVDT